MLDLAGQPRATGPGQRPLAQVEAEVGVLAADEVEHGQAGLVVGEAQASAELLQEDGRRSRWAAGRGPCRLGDVDALVEEVDGEDAR